MPELFQGDKREMNRTKIEWCDYTINPVKGLCPMACSYCYARAMYKRFKWETEVEWCPRVFRGLDKLKPGSRVFVGSTIELFGEWVKEIWLKLTFEEVSLHPDLTFIFLTKQPQNLIKWSPFPDNCWVGVSYEGAGIAKRNPKRYGFTGIYAYMKEIEAKIKFMSVEPMLADCKPLFNGLHIFDWLIIGEQTPHNPRTAPMPIWVRELTDAAKGFGLAVFHKNNLGNIFDADGFPMRQEWPK